MRQFDTTLGKAHRAIFPGVSPGKAEPAEFTASYLCGIAGIESRTLENSSAYIACWLSVLGDKKTKKWIPWAASQAQKAADYIQGVPMAAKNEEREAA